MLSKEKAKFKSTLDNIKSQIDKDKTLNKKLIHTRGIFINSTINLIIFLIVMGLVNSSKFIADFKKSWFMVSQILVMTIRKKIKIKPSFILALLAFLCC